VQSGGERAGGDRLRRLQRDDALDLGIRRTITARPGRDAALDGAALARREWLDCGFRCDLDARAPDDVDRRLERRLERRGLGRRTRRVLGQPGRCARRTFAQRRLDPACPRPGSVEQRVGALRARREGGFDALLDPTLLQPVVGEDAGHQHDSRDDQSDLQRSHVRAISADE
jgi:hypothetical protein